MSYKGRYARYLATPDYETFIIHCLTIRHPAFGFPRRIQNGITEEFVAVTEGGKKRVYLPSAFEIQSSRVGLNTHQRLQVNLDAMDGDIYIALRAIDFKARWADPVTITHRIYMSSNTGAPVIDPPAKYELYEIVPEPQVLRCDARAAGLGDIPAGKLYTIEEYPILGAQP